MFYVKKRYPHSLGLSACFRQPKAVDTHCRWLHGYPLAFTYTFAAATLDARDWVLNFGSLKPVKARLESMYDHKLLVSEKDPHLDILTGLAGFDLADPIVVPAVGCEAFAQMEYEWVAEWLNGQSDYDVCARVFIAAVECAEHETNSAIYDGPTFLPRRESFVMAEVEA